MMTQEHPPTSVPSRLRDEPLSVKFTYDKLSQIEPARQEDLARDMQTPKRTIRHALSRLDELGEVEETNHSGDARKKWFKRTRNGGRNTGQ